MHTMCVYSTMSISAEEAFHPLLQSLGRVPELNAAGRDLQFRHHGNEHNMGKGLKYGVKPPFFRVHCGA
jgi:hypothetical protein